MSDRTDSNASPSAFGWQFQVNAGIYLMLDDLKRYKSINVEGELQDIELTTKEGKLELVQAKATYEPYMHHKDTNERKKYTDKQSKKASEGIEGLVKSFNKKKSCDSVIYLFNAEYIFGTKAKYSWSHGETRKYNELRSKEIEVVNKIIDSILTNYPDNNNLRSLLLDKLIFKKLNYEKLRDWKTTHFQLLDKISAFLEDLGISKHRNEDYLLTMQALCNYDTQDKHYKKTDEDFVWIAMALDLDFRADSFASSFPNLDTDDTLSFIEEKYKLIIASVSNRFSTLNEVINRYSDFHSTKQSQKERYIEFASNNNDLLNDILPNDIEAEEREALRTYIICNILNKQKIAKNAYKKNYLRR